MRPLRSSAPARWARLSGGASSILAGRSDWPPTRACWPGLMNAPSIHSVSAAAGAQRRLESVRMHRSACWAGYPSDSSRRLTAAGVGRISSDATTQGLRLRRRRRPSPPAPSAGRISGRPGAAGSASVRPADHLRPGPTRSRPRSRLLSPASGGSSSRLPALSRAGLAGPTPGGGALPHDRRSGRTTSLRPPGRGGHPGRVT